MPQPVSCQQGAHMSMLLQLRQTCSCFVAWEQLLLSGLCAFFRF